MTPTLLSLRNRRLFKGSLDEGSKDGILSENKSFGGSKDEGAAPLDGAALDAL